MQQLSKKSMAAIIAGLVLIIVIAGTSIWLTSAVYTKHDQSRMVRTFGFWLPAVKVGSNTITYGDFLGNMDTVKIYLNSQAAKDAGLNLQITPEVEKNSLDRMVREKIVQNLAKEKGITVPDEEVRAAFANLVAMTSTTVPNVAQYLDESFHWTEEEFRAKVVYPELLEEKLAAAFSSSTEDQLALLEQEIAKRQAGKDVKYYLKFE